MSAKLVLRGLQLIDPPKNLCDKKNVNNRKKKKKLSKGNIKKKQKGIVLDFLGKFVQLFLSIFTNRQNGHGSLSFLY